MTLLKLLSIILLLALVHFEKGFCGQDCKPKIAIVGAGIGGASASHFLTKLFNKNLNIDIFESNKVGGRLATVSFGEDEFESGGSVILPSNKYMKDFVKLLNLYPRPASIVQKGQKVDFRYGIYNGKEFVVKQNNYQLVTMFNLLLRYGLQPMSLVKYVGSFWNDFDNIYSLQDQGVAFENVTTLLSALNQEYADLLEVSIKDHLIKKGFGEKIIDEIVKAAVLITFGQSTDVHSFLASVSLANTDGSTLWSVNGGNKKIPELLISNNDKVSLLYSNVEKINRILIDDVPKYELFYEEKGKDDITSKVYDIVIVSAPQTKDQKSRITFTSFQDPIEFLGEYQEAYLSFVKGNANYSYFGLDDQIKDIFSCDPTKTEINSIGKVFSVDDKKDNHLNVWRVFSNQRLSKTIMNKLFTHVEEVRDVVWKGYPHYSTAPRLDKFKLDDHLYYTNAIEWAAGDMERAAMSGRNAAILAFNNYKLLCPSLAINKPSSRNEKSEL